MSEMIFLFLGWALGYYACKFQVKADKHDAGRFCVYQRSDGNMRFAQLAQDMKLKDDYAIIKLVAIKEGHVPFKTPFCIESEKIRFYTNKGEAINTVNWKELIPQEKDDETL